MRQFACFFLAAICLMGCHRSSSKAVPPLPSVRTEDVPAPARPSVVLERGSNLRAVAGEAYGHEDFSGFVAALNGIANPELAMAGATLKTPSLSVALRDAGLDPKYQPAINALALSCVTLRGVLPYYEKERDGSTTRPVKLSTGVKDRMVWCADAIDAALEVLRHPAPGHSVPKSTIGKLEGVSQSLRFYAAGNVESRDYDTFMLEKGFGLGFTYVLIWAQSHHH